MGDWLNKLKVGDTVIVSAGWQGDRLGKVERVTATQIVVGGSRYRKVNGNIVGAQGYSREGLYEATPHRVATVRKAYLARKFSGAKWHDLSLEDLEKVEALVRGFKVSK